MAEAGTDSRRENGKKNIVVCCDGTGNQFIETPEKDGSNSNVVKFYTTLRIKDEQVGYYHPGVGTADDPAARGPIAGRWSKVKGLAFAAGFKENVLDAYRYLMNTYNDGDFVYLIGFSRGAYTVRALAGLLDGYGLLCPGNEGHLPYAWNSYVRQHNDRTQDKVVTNRAFKETFSRKIFRIRFLGIWDTVSSVGWINTPLRLFSIAQNPTVKIGRHAVSIDERRCFYRDNLWEPASQDQLAEVATAQDPHPTQDLLEVWFPGVHSDVGGSYSQDTSGLSNVALKWLLDEADSAGADMKPYMKQLVLGEKITEPVDGADELNRVDVLRKLYPKPTVTEVHDSLQGPWWLLELLPHRYYDQDDGTENWRTPLGMRRRLPSGNTITPDGTVITQKALIHRQAKEMMDAGCYNPPNVVGGVSSLKETEVPGQESGSVFLYDPPDDRKPVRNSAVVRWGVMVAVSAADVLALALAAKGLRALWRRL